MPFFIVAGVPLTFNSKKTIDSLCKNIQDSVCSIPELNLIGKEQGVIVLLVPTLRYLSKRKILAEI